MKTWKSVISAVLAGLMILSTIVTVGAANVAFTDTSGHWAKSQIEYLVSKEVLNGYKQSNGTYTFKPDGTVTRAEFVKMLDETFGLTSTAPINYSDVKTSDWFHTYFSKAAAQGYLLNYGTSVSPNGQLTREEATTLLVRYLGLLDAPKASSTQFTDYNSISSNFRDPVMIAVQAGLINGYKENNGTYTFRPKNTLTRAEALTILYRAAGAIYNTSAYSKDAGSADTNAVITRGGVTVSGLTLGGRVIVTEGASGNAVTLTGCTIPGTLEIRGASNVTLDKCTVNEMTVDSIAPEITVSLTGSSKVTSLTLDSKISLAASTGSRVSSMTVNTGAKNVKVTGDGAIGSLSVYAAGFVSTMMPDEFFVASGLTANFASKPYTGTSDDQASFITIPFITEESGKYCLNVMPDATGRVHYYFTNQYNAPTSAEFDAAYSAANYKNSFAVQSGKVYTQPTVASSTAKNYDYVVIQLVTDSRAYAPIIIDNITSSGTGFEIDPYFDGEDIVYKTSASGTVYYYYTDDGKDLTAAQFQNGYKAASASMRGTGITNTGRTGYITLKEQYLSSYPYVAVVLETANGQYFKPVVVAAGSNGFDVEPKVTTIGTIEFKTNVTGTLYYYYSKSEELPSPQEFANNWPLERGKASVSVTANKNG
ncbi:MAG: S-layer homology domain-containing protein, partial [Clostridia bacterium]|nr:S-layer homology domain-containing protein [Clostridia bacterium]